MENSKRIIEINGVKMEIDLRNATVIDNFKVGDTIKVLVKGYNDYRSHVGMIVGFDEFQKLPTIVIAYLDIEYSGANIKFVYYNSESKDVEICRISDWDIPFSKQQIIDKLNSEIAKKENELQEINSKKELFLTMFGKFFDGKVSNGGIE